jgi:Ser-tRNA(Ala) deacylase AlaX
MTTLLYMTDNSTEYASVKVEKIDKNENGTFTVILDKTIFYPQGGGQPYDQGKILNSSGIFNVAEVRFVEGEVYHIGTFENGAFSAGEEVKLNVDPERRLLNSKLQSAGHLIDMALRNIGYKEITPVKGFHFPEGPYVEYDGEISGENLLQNLQTEIDRMTNSGFEVVIKMSTPTEAKEICYFFPEYIPEGKPIRIVSVWNNEFIPCGGTHVKNISELNGLKIKEIKNKKGNTRVSYTIQ